ncbi:hypothetical protein FGIG_03131 [Fasciola gigantica]|uniref:Uncharacterized protein n=1 Tax=Fasciola gigantica TaxID=46835 RepID=A0A504YPE2_FASGI|nr:hypothetical protein FGIG_03131 [Fasciola gigantica]
MPTYHCFLSRTRIHSGSGHDGTILLITGSTGSGKTTHLTALTMSLFSPLWAPTKGRSSTDFDESDPRARLLSRVSTSTNITTSIDMSVRPKLAPHQLFMHFTDGLVVTGLPPKTQLLSLLNRWTDLLVEEIQLAARVSAHVTKKLDDVCGEAASNLVGGKGALLKSKMLCLSKLIGLLEMFPTRYYAFILDAADRLQPPLLDWLPTVLPSNVRVVLTCDARSSMARYLSSKPDCLAYTVTSLSLAERSAAVRSLLGRYGKVLNESGFRNQLDYQLKKLPDTVPVLVRHIVARAEAQSGSELVLMTLGLLACSRRPLSSVDLCTLLDAWLEDRRGIKPSRTVEPSWKDLVPLPSTADNLRSESSLEQAIEKLILEEQDISITSGKTPKRAHIPSLAFHILLSGIRPLLAGLGDEDEPAASNSEHELTIASSNQWGLIRLRNTELVQLIQDICFNANKKSLSTFSRLGYHKPTGPFLPGSSNSAKRLRLTTQCPDPGEPSRQFTGTLDRKYIHWLLATRLPGLDNKVYHFFHAGQLEVVIRLLGSPTFLIERLRSGQGSFLLEDFQGYPTSDIEIQEAWVKRTQTGDSAGMLAAMRQFIANNSMILTKYPFLFYELAANYNTDPWIRRLGLMHIKSRKEALKSDVIPNPIRFLVRRPQSVIGNELDVNAAHMPHTVCHPSDVASVVALSPNGRLLIYGTQTGTVTLINTTTMREIRSFYGHSGAVLSLCFLGNHRTSKQDSYRTSGTEFSLVSTARDQTICLWLIPNLGGGSAMAGMTMDTEIGRRLASWTGPQNSDITCSAWHPDRGLLATGSLDCTVVLWNPPRGTDELITKVTTSDAQPVAPPADYKVRFACHSPVSCLAFRLPSSTASEPQNDLAVGCWDGNVRIFDVEQQQLKICVNISTSSICSVDYSVPDDGALFVVQDLKGVLLFLRSDHYIPLTTVKTDMYQNREKLTDTLLEPWVPRHGQAYFARPSGRYLIQSGGSGAEDGHLIVWNAQLGADCGQWFTSKSWNVLEKQIRRVTACAADPCGRFLVVGSDCRLAVVCSKTGRMLTRSFDVECRIGEDYPVSCVACALMSKRPIDETDVAEYFCAAGTSSGNLVIFSFSLNQSSKTSNCPFELEDFHQLWVTLLTDRPGGLLSLDTTGSITAVGSAHGEAYVITSSMNSPFDVTTLTDMGGSPITCVKIGGKLIAFGSKNGFSHFDKFMTESPKPRSRERTKSADQSGDTDTDSLNIFARMDVTGLLKNEPNDDDDDEISSTASLMEIDNAVESVDDVGTVAVADTDTDAPNKNTSHLVSLQQHAPIGHHTFVREGVRSRSQKAAMLRLIVEQEILLSDGDNKGQAQFRTRTYAPLVLEQRAHLQGHLGLIANSLSSTVSTRSITDCECILVSVAQRSNLIDQNNLVGCDIRLWQVPVYGTPKQEIIIKHTGAVTSFTRILERNRTVWLVSGGTDGSLIFWRSDHSAAVRNAAQSLVTGGAPWIPAFRLICSNVKITSLVAFPPPSEFPDHICVCIAIGRRILLICLHKQILPGLESQRSVGLDQLLRMFDQLSARVIYAS